MKILRHPLFMRPTPESELEQAIDRELRTLSELAAPATLLPRVLNALAAREARPWWRREYSAWPRSARVVFLAGSSSLGAVLLYFAWGVGAGLSVGALSMEAREVAGGFNLIGGALGALGGAMVSLIKAALSHSSVLWIGSGLLAACYFTTFALGTACYRLVSRRI